MIVQDFLNQYYGAPTRGDEIPLSTAPTTSPTRILANDPSRVHFYISNTGSVDVTVYDGDSVSTSKGILIPANGGILTLKAPDHGDYTTHEWYAVAASGTGQLTIRTTRFFKGLVPAKS